jgi:hypothetical protein
MTEKQKHKQEYLEGVAKHQPLLDRLESMSKIVEKVCPRDLLVLKFCESKEDLNSHKFSDDFIQLLAYLLYDKQDRYAESNYTDKHKNLYLRGK